MGKLSKLRREIEKDPEKWMVSRTHNRLFSSRTPTPRYRAIAAHTEPRWTGDKPYSPGNGRNEQSYRAFVRSILRELGYEVE